MQRWRCRDKHRCVLRWNDTHFIKHDHWCSSLNVWSLCQMSTLCYLQTNKSSKPLEPTISYFRMNAIKKFNQMTVPQQTKFMYKNIVLDYFQTKKMYYFWDCLLTDSPKQYFWLNHWHKTLGRCDYQGFYHHYTHHDFDIQCMIIAMDEFLQDRVKKGCTMEQGYRTLWYKFCAKVDQTRLFAKILFNPRIVSDSGVKHIESMLVLKDDAAQKKQEKKSRKSKDNDKKKKKKKSQKHKEFVEIWDLVGDCIIQFLPDPGIMMVLLVTNRSIFLKMNSGTGVRAMRHNICNFCALAWSAPQNEAEYAPYHVGAVSISQFEQESPEDLYKHCDDVTLDQFHCYGGDHFLYDPSCNFKFWAVYKGVERRHDLYDRDTWYGSQYPIKSQYFVTCEMNPKMSVSGIDNLCINKCKICNKEMEVLAHCHDFKSILFNECEFGTCRNSKNNPLWDRKLQHQEQQEPIEKALFYQCYGTEMIESEKFGHRCSNVELIEDITTHDHNGRLYLMQHIIDTIEKIIQWSAIENLSVVLCVNEKNFEKLIQMLSSFIARRKYKLFLEDKDVSIVLVWKLSNEIFNYDVFNSRDTLANESNEWKKKIDYKINTQTLQQWNFCLYTRNLIYSWWQIAVSKDKMSFD